MLYTMLTSPRFALFVIAPALFTMIMMLDGRFSGSRRWFPRALFGHLALGLILVVVYVLGTSPIGFDETLGILGMPGFQAYATGTVLGLLLAGLVILYEDLRSSEVPDDSPKGREDIPEPEQGSGEVIELPRKRA